MNESSGHGAESLEDVFAELIRRAEAGEQVNASEFSARYPQWSDDIAELLAGRADLERFAKQLGDATTPVSRLLYCSQETSMGPLGSLPRGLIRRSQRSALRTAETS